MAWNKDVTEEMEIKRMEELECRNCRSSNTKQFCENCKPNKTKTEDLNFQEACAAIGRGECVEDQHGDIFSLEGKWVSDLGKWKIDYYFYISGGPWRIVPEPSKQVEEKPHQHQWNTESYCECGIHYKDTSLEYKAKWSNIPIADLTNPRSLTYEQALECEGVRIHFPDVFGTKKEVFIKGINGDHGGWSRGTALFFDLAERRGYRMDRVD